MTFFVGFWSSKSAVSDKSVFNISVKQNNIDTKTYNYKLSAILALFWKKSNDLQKLMIWLDTRCSVSSHHGIPLSVVREKKS